MIYHLQKLAWRDIKKTMNKRTLFIWIILSAICIYFFFASSGRSDFVKTGRIEYMVLFLPQIIFGAWAVLSVYYDLISSDRQKNVLDCILCSGVTKTQIYISKIITAVIVSFLLALLYLLPITGILMLLGESPVYIRILLQYLIPLWAFIMIYAGLGTFISVLARSSKSALIWSLAAGLILMPRFFMIVMDGLSTLFHWSQTTKENISMLAPGIMLQALSDGTEPARRFIAVSSFTLGIVLLFLIAYKVFNKQDEFNYGE